MTVRLLATAAAAAALTAIPLTTAQGGSPRLITRATPSTYRLILQAKVETPRGVPRSGYDPSVRRQRRLADVARQRQGAGAITSRPAAGLKPKAVRRAAADVLPPRGLTTPLTSGCAKGYGVPGEHCLPARARNNQPMRCPSVLRQFPSGIAVTGRDTLGLDSNRDGRACGKGDDGVPAAAHKH